MSAQEERASASRSESIRSSNEHIADQAERYRFTSRVPMLCECSDPACRELVLIRLRDYRAARRGGSRFLTAPGHEASGTVHRLLRAADDGPTA